MKTLFLVFLLIATPAFAQHDEGLMQTMDTATETMKEIMKEIAHDVYCFQFVVQRAAIDEQLKIKMIHIISTFMDHRKRFSGPFVIERIEKTQHGLHFTEDGYVVSITVYGTSNRSRSYLLLIRDDTILASQSIPLITEKGCSS